MGTPNEKYDGPRDGAVGLAQVIVQTVEHRSKQWVGLDWEDRQPLRHACEAEVVALLRRWAAGEADELTPEHPSGRWLRRGPTAEWH